MKIKLYGPADSVNLTHAEMVARGWSNGCGAGGSKFDFVPDSLLGCCIEIPCGLHDRMYTLGQTQADKVFSDKTFLANMLAVIRSMTPWYRVWMWWRFAIRKARIAEAMLYYCAVRDFGAKAFWAGKDVNLVRDHNKQTLVIVEGVYDGNS